MRSKSSTVALDIIAKDIGKKYGRHWIFRHLDFEVAANSRVAITGSNGSGKSTLLQIISGYLTPSQGKITLSGDGTMEDQLVTFIGPYSELIEEFSLEEFLNFHSKFRSATIPFEEMAQRANLPLKKSISEFSTGMKQRVKLITAFFFQNDYIFFDEPTSNLDQSGFDWWKEETLLLKDCTILNASNQQAEIAICEKSIDL